MSLPSSEPLPDDINELTPARQRHLRRMPRSASPAEHEILMEALLATTAPHLEFFLLLLLGGLATAASLYFNEPILLLLAIVLLPFLNPIFNLALLPSSLKPGNAVKSIILLAVAILVCFASGALIGWFVPNADYAKLAVLHFAWPYWLDAVLVAGSAIFCSVVILRQDRLPRLAGALLSYEILIPLAIAGFGLATGHTLLWPGALLTSGIYFGLALVVSIFTFIVLGLLPDSLTGWLIALLPLALSLALLTATLFFNLENTSLQPEPTATPTSTQAPSQTPSPKALVSTATATNYPPTATLEMILTETETQTTITSTAGTPEPTSEFTDSPTETPTATATPTVVSTPSVGIVYAENGAVVREGPDFSNPVVAYVYHGEQVTILGEAMSGYTLWYEIEKNTGEVGWILGSLLRIPTPSP